MTSFHRRAEYRPRHPSLHGYNNGVAFKTRFSKFVGEKSDYLVISAETSGIKPVIGKLLPQGIAVDAQQL